MRRTPSLAILSLFVAIVGQAATVGCTASPRITVVRLGPGAATDAVDGDPVTIRRGGQEAYVGLRGGFYVVRSVEDWRNVWPSGNEPALPSMLDPRRLMLLLAAAEQKDVVGLKIRKVVETGDKVHVFVQETKAGEKCTAKPEHEPTDAVVASRIDKPVKFHVEVVREESCGDPPAVSVRCRLEDAAAWTEKLVAKPGDGVECEMSTAVRGKFAIVDSALTMGALPGGSASKLAFPKGPSRGALSIDVFGSYSLRGEATDESGRKSVATATIDALPPKTRDVVAQLVWANFDASDDPDTFPRVKLRAFEDARDVKSKAKPAECSVDAPRPDLCQTRARGAYTVMTLPASAKRIPLDVVYSDERIEKGPLVCVHLYFDGARTGETCDRKHRDASERWQVGTVDMATGKLVEAAPPAAKK